ncbi:50S ribosomal protein L33 [Candidatus Babeliales bacterium]|nr:50S ribosomal protein L33 [Candidatus Babeliales bacterium]
MAKNRVISHLVCSECKERNYSQVVAKSRSVGSLQVRKHCRRCKKHQMHKESK